MFLAIMCLLQNHFLIKKITLNTFTAKYEPAVSTYHVPSKIRV